MNWEQVAAGEPLLEVEAEKVNHEIEAPVSGRIESIVAEEGDEIKVGATLAFIVEECQRRFPIKLRRLDRRMNEARRSGQGGVLELARTREQVKAEFDAAMAQASESNWGLRRAPRRYPALSSALARPTIRVNAIAG